MKFKQLYLEAKITPEEYKKKIAGHSAATDQKLKGMSKAKKIALLKKNGITTFGSGKFEEPVEETKPEHIDQMIWHNSMKKNWKW